MQSIFRLPWCSENPAPKKPDRAALEKVRPTPVVEIPVWNKLKRKRTNSLEETPSSRSQQKKQERLTADLPSRFPSKLDVQQTFKQAPDTPDSLEIVDGFESPCSIHDSAVELKDAGGTKSASHEDTTSMEDTGDKVVLGLESSADGLTPLQQMIENEFNMQILVKHNELRLIEQELAKCQVALEQLRRVELSPYPGSDQLSEDVSAGTGASIMPAPGYTKPRHPAPYGVTDGPYTRHYNQWLLHDPLFDSTPVQAASFDFNGYAAGRSTRNSGSVRKSISKPFIFPARPGDTLQSIPNYPAPPVKDKSAPLILKRSTDNQFVKLVCNNCLRGNFSSIQGFLNHCRIAHKVDYKSHDAAAVDCGRLLEEHEAANLPIETHATPVHKPSLSRISTTTTTTPYSRHLVHPLNSTASPTIARSQNTTAQRIAVQSLASAVPSSTASPLTASPSLPRLSAHFAKHALGGDLKAAVEAARTKIDLGIDEDLSSPDISEQNSPLDRSAAKPGSKRASMMSMPGARPTSNKGIRPRPSPLAPIERNGVQGREFGEMMPESPYHRSSLDLSPHTADSNPGLVSDHEDDDAASASEEEAPASEISRPLPLGGATCSDNVEVEVAEDEEVDSRGVRIRRNSVVELSAGTAAARKLGLAKRKV